jgi:hypothetical protein|tara:strand:- start:653 stop:820 length:168 start_codon:yes stop_codon:yes gene_type:complete
MEPFEAIVTFYVNCGLQQRTWSVEKEFKSKQHLENFISYIERKKGYNLDEVHTIK